jgi:ABC-type Mn2+/Zn2+ transport system permease subunit
MLSNPFMQRALAEVLILAVACGPLGVWVLLYRQSYAAESLSHAMLPGLVVASLAGVSLLLGAAAGVLVAAAAIALAGRDERLGGDVGVAVAIASLFGLGALLALSPDVPARLGELLFGDLLGVTTNDLLAAAALSAGVLIALAVAYRSLSLAGFEQRGGRADLALLALLGVTTVAAVQGLGNLLLVALILAPAAAALNLASRLPQILTLAAILAVVSGVVGLVISYQLEIAAGASIALCAIALSALGMLKPKLGVP